MSYLLAMRICRSFLVMVLFGCAWIAPACYAQSDPAAVSAIHHLLDQQTADWNRGDVVAFMKAYENSPKTAFVGDTVEYGYATILGRYKKLYASPSAMGKLTFTNLDVRILDAHFAVVTGNFHLQRPKTAGGDAGGIFSLIFRKTSLGWRIILDHTARTS